MMGWINLWRFCWHERDRVKWMLMQVAHIRKLIGELVLFLIWNAVWGGALLGAAFVMVLICDAVACIFGPVCMSPVELARLAL
jgi:hypothetical protein